MKSRAALPVTLAVVLLGLTPLGFAGGAAQAAFPGQNGRFAVYSGQEIWVANVDGANLTRLTAAPGLDRSPRWSPDGTEIAFASGRNGNSEIFVMNADGSDQRQITFSPGRDRISAWTGDGTQIVYDKEFTEIYAINADGSGGERKIADGALPSTSRYGNKIAFSSAGGGIVAMGLDGSARTQVTPVDTGDFSPTWSPGGTDLVFTRPSGDDRDVYRIHANGVGLVRLTNTPTRSEVGPVWSPDGTKIAFLGCPPPLGSAECGVHVMNRDGSSETQVPGLTGSFAESPLDWQPVAPFPQGSEPVKLTVGVVATGGAGFVTSEPLGLECPPACSTEFDRGSTVRLSARPGGAIAFLGWTGACSGRRPSCTLEMDGEKNVRAVFGKATFRLTVSVRGPGRVLSSPAGIACAPRCASSFRNGARVLLRPRPATGARFVSWSGACRGQERCTVTMGADRVARARFRR